MEIMSPKRLEAPYRSSSGMATISCCGGALLGTERTTALPRTHLAGAREGARERQLHEVRADHFLGRRHVGRAVGVQVPIELSWSGEARHWTDSTQTPRADRSAPRSWQLCVWEVVGGWMRAWSNPLTWPVNWRLGVAPRHALGEAPRQLAKTRQRWLGETMRSPPAPRLRQATTEQRAAQSSRCPCQGPCCATGARAGGDAHWPAARRQPCCACPPSRTTAWRQR